jgi:hypothetical protein
MSKRPATRSMTPTWKRRSRPRRSPRAGRLPLFTANVEIQSDKQFSAKSNQGKTSKIHVTVDHDGTPHVTPR